MGSLLNRGAVKNGYTLTGISGGIFTMNNDRGRKIIKFLRLFDLLCRANGASKNDIAEDLGISQRSVYRQLNLIDELGFLYEQFDDPVTNRKRWRLDRKYCRKTPLLDLPDLYLTPQELIALIFLRGESKIFQGTGLEEYVNSAFKKLENMAPPGMGNVLEKYRPLILMDARLSKRLDGKEKMVEILTDAIIERQTCRVKYHSFIDDRVKTFKIAPLHFFEHNGGLYIFVNASSFDRILTLAVERMVDVKLNEGDTFEYPDDFDPETMLSSAFGVVFDDYIEVKIWFAPSQARYIRERIWSSDQKITKNDDGSIILEMKTSGRYEVKRWVMGYGPDAEVLEPDDLRQEISEDIDRMQERMGKNNL